VLVLVLVGVVSTTSPTTRSKSNSDDEEEDHNKSYSMMEHIQVMGIANAQQTAQRREQARVNSLVISMHAKNVSGIHKIKYWPTITI
jgi:hypothetical protein